jgi:hypothetical protein
VCRQSVIAGVMMRKSRKIGVLVAFGLIVLIGGFELHVGSCFDTYTDDRQGRAMNDLRVIGFAIRKLIEVDKLTPEVWKRIDGMEGISALIAPQLEQGKDGLLDPWGQQYLLEKREENSHLIVKISCNRRYVPRCLEWKEREMAIELTIAKQDGKVIQTKHLWMVD